MLCFTLATDDDDDDDDDNDVGDSEYVPGPDVSKQRKKCMSFYHLKCILVFRQCNVGQKMVICMQYDAVWKWIWSECTSSCVEYILSGFIVLNFSIFFIFA